MKQILNKTILGLLLAASALSFQSCFDDDDDNNYDLLYPDAIVTVKPVIVDGEALFYMQLDDLTRLYPSNMTVSPYGDKEIRALVNYTEEGDNLSISATDYVGKNVHVNWIDSILTKPMAADLGTEENLRVYGNDPVELTLAVVEDGYLTLRFRTAYSGHVTHFVNLLSTNNPENPYEVEFRHHAYGDIHGTIHEGYAAFRLDQLPNAGNIPKLTLKWKSFYGEKSIDFDFRYTTSSFIKEFD